jgi:hypothetical protein
MPSIVLNGARAIDKSLVYRNGLHVVRIRTKDLVELEGMRLYLSIDTDEH